MPNPVPARYTVQLGPTFTPEVAGELSAWAELLGRSTAEIARECTQVGLEQLRVDYAMRAGIPGQHDVMPPAEVLQRHVAAAEVRGNRQIERRLNYDKRTREAAARATAAPVKRTRAKRAA